MDRCSYVRMHMRVNACAPPHRPRRSASWRSTSSAWRSPRLGPHVVHSHTVHLPLGALLSPCPMCVAQVTSPGAKAKAEQQSPRKSSLTDAAGAPAAGEAGSPDEPTRQDIFEAQVRALTPRPSIPPTRDPGAGISLHAGDVTRGDGGEIGLSSGGDRSSRADGGQRREQHGAPRTETDGVS